MRIRPKSAYWLSAAIVILLTVNGCTIFYKKEDAKTFHCQVHGASYQDLRKLDVDIMVIDCDDALLTRKQIAELKDNGTKVLSYLSIGEAERYRKYWKPRWKEGYPSFIDKENPQCKGNYRVEYWNELWQEITLERVQEIARDGYDGVYLDAVDVYYHYEYRGRRTAREEMFDFIRKIRHRGRTYNPLFLVVAQNTAELYAFKEYRGLIDGLGIEDLWYDGNKERNVEDIQYILKFLDMAKKQDKIVLVVDYPTDKNKICDFYKKCEAHRFAGTVSNRELNLKEPVRCGE